MNIEIKDFQLLNHWKIDRDGPIKDSGEPSDLIDGTTKKIYRNEPKWLIRSKCVILTALTPILHTTAAVLYTARKILKLFIFAHFWMPQKKSELYDFKARTRAARKDVVQIFTFPIALLGLELAAFYGILNPYDGRKLYGSIERALYDKALLAPCFQPSCTADDEE